MNWILRVWKYNLGRPETNKFKAFEAGGPGRGGMDGVWGMERGNSYVIMMLHFFIVKSLFLQGYIFWPFLSKLKIREEFEGGLEKKGKEEKEKSHKTHVKIPL